jgi:hypothetical protein
LFGLLKMFVRHVFLGQAFLFHWGNYMLI